MSTGRSPREALPDVIARRLRREAGRRYRLMGLIALGVVLLDERLSGTALLGATLVIAGLLMTVVSVAARPRSATPRPPGAVRPSGGA